MHIILATLLGVCTVHGAHWPTTGADGYFAGDGTVSGDIKLDIGEKLYLDWDATQNDLIYGFSDNTIYFNTSGTNRLQLSTSSLSLQNGLNLDIGTGAFYSSSGVAQFGAACVSSHGLSANDICIQNDSETNGNTYLDGPLYLSPQVPFLYTTGTGVFYTAMSTQSVNSMSFALGSSSRYLLILEYADRGTDFGFANPTNPTLVLQSSDATSVTDRLYFFHDQTDGVIATDGGDLKLSAAGGLHITTETAFTPASDQALAAGDTATSGTTIIRVQGSGGAVTSTADPTIANGTIDGQIIYVIGLSDANTWTPQDETNNAGSTLELAGGANFTMGLGDTLQLIWDSGDSKWYEISRSDN